MDKCKLIILKHQKIFLKLENKLKSINLKVDLFLKKVLSIVKTNDNHLHV